MFAGIIGVTGAGRLTLSGLLTTTSASSPVTSATRTITGAGALRFDSIVSAGGGPEYQLNGGAWTTIVQGAPITVVGSDTIAVRASLLVAAQTATFTLRNHASGALIEDVVLTRS
jgi:hypothetical protein